MEIVVVLIRISLKMVATEASSNGGMGGEGDGERRRVGWETDCCSGPGIDAGRSPPCWFGAVSGVLPLARCGPFRRLFDHGADLPLDRGGLRR